ncbi:MAG: hypothetical protein CEN88_86 [Candidatus Berkelbacteria bacterium Licking1014_2]|uniref:HicB-like antitoxin of toxin-antitoxin system domain-containing protein n=1 Tax=Candidatus Berkelbacteria bacterium Licking1014_2 TaxID=2017146 RepID=A0A554LWN7_9BACT|nr:MAG: hypothetical protein CEN88_86 [Candidatus Berkelbacteria bacterium Licking1014_2]
MKQAHQIHEYTAVFQTAPEGGYTVTVPALPGCISEGDNFEKAKKKYCGGDRTLSGSCA